jgi:hypothetical protein
VTSGALVRGDQHTWGGDNWRPPTLSALRVVSTTTGNRGGAWDRATILGGQNGNGLLTSGPGSVKQFSNFQTPLKIVNPKKKPSLAQKIFKLCVLLDLNILNNFISWVDFKFSTKYML